MVITSLWPSRSETTFTGVPALLQHVTDLQLNALLAGVWVKATAGDVRASEQALRVIDRRCKLFGLDAATRVQVLGDGLSLNEIEAQIDALESELGSDAGHVAIAPADPVTSWGQPQPVHPWGTQLPRS